MRTLQETEVFWDDSGESDEGFGNSKTNEETMNEHDETRTFILGLLKYLHISHSHYHQYYIDTFEGESAKKR
jgi:hypothetical protein